MSAEACAWAVRQRVGGPQRMLALLFLAVAADARGRVAHGALRGLADSARKAGVDLLAELRALIDARLILYGCCAFDGYTLMIGCDFGLREEVVGP